jgi:hypothetical protein
MTGPDCIPVWIALGCIAVCSILLGMIHLAARACSRNSTDEDANRPDGDAGMDFDSTTTNRRN